MPERLPLASRLGQHAAYDGFYLALADSLSAEFWTAEVRLFKALQSDGTSWAHVIQEVASYKN